MDEMDEIDASYVMDVAYVGKVREDIMRGYP